MVEQENCTVKARAPVAHKTAGSFRIKRPILLSRVSEAVTFLLAINENFVSWLLLFDRNRLKN